ncbi:hypothetical protein [Nitrosomonas sp. Nm34]|uniref:hypothetical protein n=1 Tax=Nitrosomonas sp. Nm34 TaxID=1881055 RepID=UPI0008E437F9|nr:hypothetical protein [Nitrosomonas sp. Nm34]SFJ10972.1 hypothetical protein SAMN05428978_11105 [Nitrosomonas sp. Nm34]
METITATSTSSSTTKKPIIHCYVKRDSNSLFKLYSQTDNALPVFHSEHYSLSEAKEEAITLGAVNCLLV